MKQNKIEVVAVIIAMIIAISLIPTIVEEVNNSYDKFVKECNEKYGIDNWYMFEECKFLIGCVWGCDSKSFSFI